MSKPSLKFDEILNRDEPVALAPILFKQTFKIENPLQWAKELNNRGEEFFKEHGYYPNIMQASSLTYDQIDFIANRNRENIHGDRPTPPNGLIGLSGFKGVNFELNMCMDELLELLQITLIYDSEPGGEDELEDEEVARKAG